MILHTKLTEAEVRDALHVIKFHGLVAEDVQFAVLTCRGSRSHARTFDLQLGTRRQFSLPYGYTDRHDRKPNGRRRLSVNGVEGYAYAATWHEWGYFIAEIFSRDPEATWRSRLGGYSSPGDFQDKTNGRFPVRSAPVSWGYWTWEHEDVPCPDGGRCPHKLWVTGNDE